VKVYDCELVIRPDPSDDRRYLITTYLIMADMAANGEERAKKPEFCNALLGNATYMLRVGSRILRLLQKEGYSHGFITPKKFLFTKEGILKLNIFSSGHLFQDTERLQNSLYSSFEIKRVLRNRQALRRKVRFPDLITNSADLFAFGVVIVHILDGDIRLWEDELLVERFSVLLDHRVPEHLRRSLEILLERDSDMRNKIYFRKVNLDVAKKYLSWNHVERNSSAIHKMTSFSHPAEDIGLFLFSPHALWTGGAVVVPWCTATWNMHSIWVQQPNSLEITVLNGHKGSIRVEKRLQAGEIAEFIATRAVMVADCKQKVCVFSTHSRKLIKLYRTELSHYWKLANNSDRIKREIALNRDLSRIRSCYTDLLVLEMNKQGVCLLTKNAQPVRYKITDDYVEDLTKRIKLRQTNAKDILGVYDEETTMTHLLNWRTGKLAMKMIKV
jgi:hypothetical protein